MIDRKKEILMALNHLKRWSIPVIVRGGQVKATVRQCLISQTGKCDKISCWEAVGTQADSQLLTGVQQT